jgi:hypothetical protein
MTVEATVSGWTGPSSATEQEKQERTERMIKQAITARPALADASISVFAKGSYANGTNVRVESDVDIAVQCHEVFFWEEAEPGAHPPISGYEGLWTPAHLREGVTAALRTGFPDQVDTTGSTAIKVHSGTARIDADVVPCFDYRFYLAGGTHREGNRIFLKSGGHADNFPAQNLENGRRKNVRTHLRYKDCVRIMKRLEVAMFADSVHREVPSFLVESLVYNCPDPLFARYSWTDRVREIIGHIWEKTQGDEPTPEGDRLLEVNECQFLFHPQQRWNRQDARDFAYAAWNYLDFG